MTARQIPLALDRPTLTPAAAWDTSLPRWRRVLALLSDGEWHSSLELLRVVGGSESALTARIRELRTPDKGGHIIPCERQADGIYRYRLVTG